MGKKHSPPTVTDSDKEDSEEEEEDEGNMSFSITEKDTDTQAPHLSNITWVSTGGDFISGLFTLLHICCTHLIQLSISVDLGHPLRSSPLSHAAASK